MGAQPEVVSEEVERNGQILGNVLKGGFTDGLDVDCEVSGLSTCKTGSAIYLEEEDVFEVSVG